MDRPLRVLIVEDSEDDATLLARALRRGGYDLTVERAESSEEMQVALSQRSWDVVISDYVMPHFSGLAALHLVRQSGLDLPFIIVSGKVGEAAAVEAMRAGAQDYITKDNLARLVPAIERELRDAAVRQEHRQLEEQLLRAQRLEMAGRLAGQVAHDLNNLVTPLVGYPQLIKKLLPPEHPALALCDALLARARQVAAVNEDLLTLGRRGRLSLEPVDLNQLVEQALAQMQEPTNSLAVHTDLAPGLPPTFGSPSQLLRVVANLVSNAREAMQDTGLLAVKTRHVRLDEPSGRYNRIEAGEYLRLSVSDTGCGIPPEILDRIFDPFFTTKATDRQRGSGLGLTIVQAILGDHRGYIDLESAAGEGTTFSLYLPVYPKPAEVVAYSGGGEGGAAVTVRPAP